MTLCSFFIVQHFAKDRQDEKFVLQESYQILPGDSNV